MERAIEVYRFDKSPSTEERDDSWRWEAVYATLDPGCDRSARSIWRSLFSGEPQLEPMHAYSCFEMTWNDLID